MTSRLVLQGCCFQYFFAGSLILSPPLDATLSTLSSGNYFLFYSRLFLYYPVFAFTSSDSHIINAHAPQQKFCVHIKHVVWVYILVGKLLSETRVRSVYKTVTKFFKRFLRTVIMVHVCITVEQCINYTSVLHA